MTQFEGEGVKTGQDRTPSFRRFYLHVDLGYTIIIVFLL